MPVGGSIFQGEFTDAEIAAFVAERKPSPASGTDGAVRLSIILPSYNQAVFLRQTLNSIANQHYPNLELIVLDGGSNDGSQDIIKEYADIVSYFESGPDGGQGAALNKGFAMASGDFIAWQNSDDIYLPGFFRAIEAAITEVPDADFLVCNSYVIDRSGRIQSPTLFGPFLVTYLTKVDWNVTSQSAFVARALVREVGPMRNINVAFDFDWFLKVGRAARSVVNIKRYGGAYRIHPESKFSIVSSGERETLERSIVAELGLKVSPDIPLSAQWPVQRRLLSLLQRGNRTILYGRLGTPRFVTALWTRMLGLCGFRMLGY
jgi:glycosyltransferase involved in cell wall biosynthesis